MIDIRRNNPLLLAEKARSRYARASPPDPCVVVVVIEH